MVVVQFGSAQPEERSVDVRGYGVSRVSSGWRGSEPKETEVLSGEEDGG